MMENTTEWLLTEAFNLVGSIFGNFFTYGAIFGISGLIIGIIIVRQGSKNNIFDRPTEMWSLFARINILYIPILLSVLLGILGSIYGFQMTTNEWVESSSTEISTYATEYIPEIKLIALELASNDAQSEDDLDDLLASSTAASSGWMGSVTDDVVIYFKRSIISMILEQFQYSDDVEGLIQFSKSQDLETLNTSLFHDTANVMQSKLHVYFFQDFYLSIWIAFFPFLMLPIIEYALFWAYTRTTQIELSKS